MKKLFVLFFLLFSFQVFSQEYSDFKWLHEKPQGNTLRWVKMWDANNWYAVGYAGTFMKTTDAGNTWWFHHQGGMMDPTDGSSTNLWDAHFFDMNNGIVVGVNGIRKTTDGGVSFQDVTGNIPSAATAYQVYFLNNQIGYVAGTTSMRMARTTDGGNTWTTNTMGVTSGTFYDVWSPNDTLIIVTSGSGNIRRSTDGGASWTQISTGATSTLYKIEMKDALNGWVCGSSSAARYTTDGGLTWTSANTGLPASTFYDLDLVGSEVWLTGNSYDLYRSTDMGTSWTAVSILNPSQPWTSTWYATDFLGGTIVSVGAFGLINTKVGSSTPITFTQFRRGGTLYDIWIGDGGKIITAGSPTVSGSSFDQIMISTDYGVNWVIGGLGDKVNPAGTLEVLPVENTEELTPNSTATFRGIDMVDDNLGFAAGTIGALYKTTNGGVSWDSIPTPIGSSFDYYGVDFVNQNYGWLFGEDINVWKTTDGGTTWTQQTVTGFSSTNEIYQGRMLDTLTGWLVGSSGHINKTTDGGTTWIDQTSVFGTSTLYSVDIIDANNAYICGASGKIAKTTEGGTLWTLLTTPSTNTLYDVDFFDTNYGAVSGATGQVLLTTDGGTTWQINNNGGSTNYGIYLFTPVNELDTAAVYTCGTNAYVHRKAEFLVPVELTSLTANVNGNNVTLNWGTATEANNLGFDVERAVNNNWEKIGFVAGKGTTSELQNYSFIDKDLAAGKYTYRIKQIDFNGTYTYYNLNETVEISAPAKFELLQNYPNPFNPSTAINYSIAKSGHVTLKIYNILGKEIMTLVNRYQEAGKYTKILSVSELGNLSSGVYFYTLDAGSFKETRKMMIMK